MFPSSSPTFSKLKCPQLDTCPFGPTQCIFSHDPSVYVKGNLDGRIGLSSMTYFKDLQQRMRAEETACKESELFAKPKEEMQKESKDGKFEKAMIENDLSKFLHRSPITCKISVSLREKVLLKLIKAMRQIDAGSSLGHAAEIEIELLKKSGGNVSSIYLSSVTDYIKRFSEKEEERKEVKVKEDLKYEDLLEIVANSESLKEYSYPSFASNSKPDTLVGLKNSVISCRRCGINFIPSKYYNEKDGNGKMISDNCRYHQGKIEKIGGLRVYGCCHAPVGDSNGCCTFEWHVFEGYKRGDPIPRFNKLEYTEEEKFKKGVVALDAEMFYTVGGYEVSRLTIVDFFTETTLLDILVEPRHLPILDYNTKWSGVSAESYEKKEMEILSFEEAKRRISGIVSSDTILIGHSLDNDLLVLEFTHNLIIDTAILYPHLARPPYRMSLRALALGYLNELVQQSLEGHDSKEDCVTCIRLVKKYFESGKREIEGKGE